MSMKRLYILIYLFALFGCSDFLEEYSQDKAYVQNYEDLDELLLGNAYFSRITSGYWMASGTGSGQFYFPWIHVVADELVQDAVSSSWFEAGKVTFGYHTWQLHVWTDPEGNKVWDDGADYRNLYAHINACNMILEELKAFEGKNDTDKQNISRIQGECYFLRGACYFLLANFYGKPYVAATASEDPAIPLKLTNYVEDKSYVRNSVAEVYQQVEKDLLTAELCLKDVPKKSVWRADVNAVRLMLSRMYLYMSSYANAKKYAELVTTEGPLLADLNIFSGGEFLTPDLSELIFSMGSSSLPGNVAIGPYSNYGNNYMVSRELYEAYAPEKGEDLRSQYFVVEDGGGLFYRKLQGGTWVKTELSDVFVLRSAEAWLNLAEAAACSDDEPTARLALKTLREKRIKQEAFDESEINDLSGEALVRFIREERQRELCLEGHRWFDLRRYRVAGKYPQAVTLTHVVTHKVQGDNWWEYNVQWTREFVLPTDDAAWVMPLPEAEVDLNTGMLNNPRNERAYKNVNH